MQHRLDPLRGGAIYHLNAFLEDESMTREEVNEKIIMLLEKLGIIQPLIQESQEDVQPENQKAV